MTYFCLINSESSLSFVIPSSSVKKNDISSKYSTLLAFMVKRLEPNLSRHQHNWVNRSYETQGLLKVAAYDACIIKRGQVCRGDHKPIPHMNASLWDHWQTRALTHVKRSRHTHAFIHVTHHIKRFLTMYSQPWEIRCWICQIWPRLQCYLPHVSPSCPMFMYLTPQNGDGKIWHIKVGATCAVVPPLWWTQKEKLVVGLLRVRLTRI